jgi:hypothetical protein
VECSNRLYEQERQLRPFDETIPYQMGVNNDSLLRTSDACCRFRQSLEINPFNRYDICSLDADAWRLRPQISTGYEFTSKQGRDGLAGVKEHQIPVSFTTYRKNRDEYLSLGYAWSELETKNKSSDTTGNAFLLSYRKWLEPNRRRWQIFTDLQVTDYDHHIDTRPTGQIGFLHHKHHDSFFGMAVRLDQVLENAGSIEQDIYRYGVSLFGESRPTLRWKTNYSVDYLRYSDDNDLFQICWENRYLLWGGRKHRFDLMGSYQYQDYRDAVTSATSDILTMKHPYFAPAGYSVFDAGIRWEWQIDKHPYNGIQEKNFFMEYRHRLDTRSTQYEVVRAGCLWETSRRLRLEGAFQCITSDEYDEYGVMIGGTWRF